MSRSHLAIVTDNVREMQMNFDELGKWKGLPQVGANVLGVIALLDIIEQLIDEKLLEEDQYYPPILRKDRAENITLISNNNQPLVDTPSRHPRRWSSIVEEVNPMDATRASGGVGRLHAWANSVRTRFSGKKFSSCDSNDQVLPLLSPSYSGRRVSFSDQVEVSTFSTERNSSEATFNDYLSLNQ